MIRAIQKSAASPRTPSKILLWNRVGNPVDMPTSTVQPGRKSGFLLHHASTYNA